MDQQKNWSKMMGGFIDLSNQIFGEWTVLSRAAVIKSNQAAWNCECSCGARKVIAGHNLRRGNSLCCRSCASKHKQLKPYESGFNRLLRRSEERKIPCPITYEEFISFTTLDKCHYCGIDIWWEPF